MSQMKLSRRCQPLRVLLLPFILLAGLGALALLGLVVIGAAGALLLEDRP